MSNKAEPDYILSLEFGTIPVVWYFFFLIFIYQVIVISYKLQKMFQHL